MASRTILGAIVSILATLALGSPAWSQHGGHAGHGKAAVGQRAPKHAGHTGRSQKAAGRRASRQQRRVQKTPIRRKIAVSRKRPANGRPPVVHMV